MDSVVEEIERWRQRILEGQFEVLCHKDEFERITAAIEADPELADRLTVRCHKQVPEGQVFIVAKKVRDGSFFDS